MWQCNQLCPSIQGLDAALQPPVLCDWLAYFMQLQFPQLGCTRPTMQWYSVSMSCDNIDAGVSPCVAAADHKAPTQRKSSIYTTLDLNLGLSLPICCILV